MTPRAAKIANTQFSYDPSGVSQQYKLKWSYGANAINFTADNIKELWDILRSSSISTRSVNGVDIQQSSDGCRIDGLEFDLGDLELMRLFFNETGLDLPPLRKESESSKEDTTVINGVRVYYANGENVPVNIGEYSFYESSAAKIIKFWKDGLDGESAYEETVIGGIDIVYRYRGDVYGEDDNREDLLKIGSCTFYNDHMQELIEFLIKNGVPFKL
jgi:hypothetical protein